MVPKNGFGLDRNNATKTNAALRSSNLINFDILNTLIKPPDFPDHRNKATFINSSITVAQSQQVYGSSAPKQKQRSGENGSWLVFWLARLVLHCPLKAAVASSIGFPEMQFLNMFSMERIHDREVWAVIR